MTPPFVIILDHCITLYGIRPFLVSYNGQQSLNKFFGTLFLFLGLKNCSTTAEHPQTNGQAERYTEPIVAHWHHFVRKHQRSWDLLVIPPTYAYTSQVWWCRESNGEKTSMMNITETLTFCEFFNSVMKLSKWWAAHFRWEVPFCTRKGGVRRQKKLQRWKSFGKHRLLILVANLLPRLSDSRPRYLHTIFKLLWYDLLQLKDHCRGTSQLLYAF